MFKFNLKDSEMCKNINQLISSIYPKTQLQWIKNNNNIKNMTKYFPTNIKVLKTNAPIAKKNSKNNKGKKENLKNKNN